MTVGNGVISGMEQGLKDNVAHGFTGDVIIVSQKQTTDNVFFDFMGKSVELLPNFPALISALEKEAAIEKFLPIGKNSLMVLNEDGPPGFAFVIGVDFKRYSSFFPNNLIVSEGQMLTAGQRGVLIPFETRKVLYDQCNFWPIAQNCSLVVENLTPEAKEGLKNLTIKDNIVFMGYSNNNASYDIRSPVSGIVKFRAVNTFWSMFILMDIESYRECMGYFSAADKSVPVSTQQQSLLTLDNTAMDNLFSDSTLIIDNKKLSQQATAVPIYEDTARLPQQKSTWNDGSYNLVLLQTKNSINIDNYEKQLCTTLASQNLGVKALSWKKATGQVGSMATLIKGSLFIFVMFLFFVAIIIIVNTLSMAALERTTEIGMMRAIGARKTFISWMFLAETALLAVVFGFIGIVSGIIMITALRLMHLKTANDMVQLLYGGETFQPIVYPTDIGLAILQLTVVILIAVIYPIRISRKITPLDAIMRD